MMSEELNFRMGVASGCYLMLGKVAVSWLKIVAANPNPNPTILSHETATLPTDIKINCSVGNSNIQQMYVDMHIVTVKKWAWH